MIRGGIRVTIAMERTSNASYRDKPLGKTVAWRNAAGHSIGLQRGHYEAFLRQVCLTLNRFMETINS
jgi:hypothetical protein